MEHRIDRGDEGVRRHQNLVAGFYAESVEGDNQRAGSVSGGEALLGAGELGEGLFELPDVLATAAEPLAAAENFQQALLFTFVEFGPGREWRGPDLAAAE